MSPQHLVLLLLASSWACAGKLEHQIIGAHEARPYSRPYMAYLKIDLSSCGGFLVAPDWVLTAGHCNGNITVILGAHDVHVPKDTQQILAVEAYYLHPECMLDEFAFNDVLLLKGDSGGPLVCNGKAEGIVSFGMDFPPAVFARIGFYLPWIKQIMG